MSDENPIGMINMIESGDLDKLGYKDLEIKRPCIVDYDKLSFYLNNSARKEIVEKETEIIEDLKQKHDDLVKEIEAAKAFRVLVNFWKDETKSNFKILRE